MNPKGASPFKYLHISKSLTKISRGEKTIDELSNDKTKRMAPLLVLLGAFLISVLVTKLLTKTPDYTLSGRIAMALMLGFTAMGHFLFTKGMAMMLPDFMLYKTEVIYLTGVFEIIAAAGLLIPGMRVWAGWALILFFILILPGNIKAAIHHIDYQKGTFDGYGPNYLWFRIPLQILFIVWTYLSSIKYYVTQD